MTHRVRLSQLEAVAKIAGCIVLETPTRSGYARTSYVRRALIKQLEQALNEAGYDMTATRKRMEALKQHERQS